MHRGRFGKISIASMTLIGQLFLGVGKILPEHMHFFVVMNCLNSLWYAVYLFLYLALITLDPVIDFDVL